MKKILVVDDEEEYRGAVVAILKGGGYTSLEADNGIDALEIALKEQPALIISDVMMSSANGFMLREFLKQDKRTAEIPLVLMTGKAQKAGAWDSDPDIDYLAKPFTAEDLLAVVDRNLSPRNRGRA